MSDAQGQLNMEALKVAVEGRTLIQQHLLDCAEANRQTMVWVRWIAGGVGALVLWGVAQYFGH